MSVLATSRSAQPVSHAYESFPEPPQSITSTDTSFTVKYFKETGSVEVHKDGSRSMVTGVPILWIGAKSDDPADADLSKQPPRDVNGLTKLSQVRTDRTVMIMGDGSWEESWNDVWSQRHRSYGRESEAQGWISWTGEDARDIGKGLGYTETWRDPRTQAEEDTLLTINSNDESAASNSLRVSRATKSGLLTPISERSESADSRRGGLRPVGKR